MSMTKDEYKFKRAEIDKQIRCLTVERATLDQEYARTLTDIRVGDKIEYDYGKQRKLGEVVGIDLWGCESVKYGVHQIKKDGSISDFKSEIYSYHNPKKIEQ